MALNDVYRYAIKAVEQEIEHLQAVKADILKEMAKFDKAGSAPADNAPRRRGRRKKAVELKKAPKRKKMGRPRKVRHAVCQADIVRILTDAKGPLTPFGITELLEEELSIKVKEKQVKAVLDSGEGSKFYLTDDSKWGLTL